MRKNIASLLLRNVPYDTLNALYFNARIDALVFFGVEYTGNRSDEIPKHSKFPGSAVRLLLHVLHAGCLRC